MKKIGFVALFAATLVAMTATGCKNQLEGANEKPVVELGEIGTLHNTILTELYHIGEANRAADAGTTEADIAAYFGSYETIAVAANSKDGIVQALVAQDIVSDAAAEYIYKVESLLANPLDTLEEAFASISAIESEAKEALFGTDFIAFESYADTAKASLLFWTENIETIDGRKEAESGRWIIKDFLKKNKDRVANAAASDAAGAAAGAVRAITIGKKGRDIVTFAGKSSALSSAKGYNENRVVVVLADD